MMKKLENIWLWTVAVFFTAAMFAAMAVEVGMIVLFITGRFK